jgi:hypothetical protein
VSGRSSKRKKSISTISDLSVRQKEPVLPETKNKVINNETNNTVSKTNSNNMNWVSKSEPIGLRVSYLNLSDRFLKIYVINYYWL